MGTVVYQQGFQSQLNEPRALRLRLSSPNPHFSQPFGLALKSHFLDSSNAEDTRNRNDDKAAASSGPDLSGWSSLQSLSSGSSSSSTKTTSSEKEKTYVQRPSSCRALSDQSLALCTENLGSESGSDVTDIDDLFSLDVQTKNLGETTTETRTVKSRKRNLSPSDLPPPLTTMRGFQCIQMRPHREDGRLVMTATKAPPRNGCFQADRSNGRLRLSILKDSDEFVENEEETIEPEETEEYEEEEEDEEEDDDEVIGIENVQMSRRCVQGDRENRGLLNWESFCVATS
ncbi:The fantastic four family [Arabidopsis thaliana x Arabidopsis arenosa]|uniref:The fantastic four family n=1 Tax=Arabidopsis thaliana x Arabidopsis arenosa TaxID=1240361 RepID=A0A8T1YYJ5_9BRAS|nr:The fantastic four family [Arabidopsis thaliana x Arabidopsis arenosa]